MVNMEERPNSGGVRGTLLTGHGRPVPTFEKGRVCHYPGCNTRLSIYNSGKYCYLHEPMVTPRVRGKKVVGAA